MGRCLARSRAQTARNHRAALRQDAGHTPHSLRRFQVFGASFVIATYLPLGAHVLALYSLLAALFSPGVKRT